MNLPTLIRRATRHLLPGGEDQALSTVSIDARRFDRAYLSSFDPSKKSKAKITDYRSKRNGGAKKIRASIHGQGRPRHDLFWKLSEGQQGRCGVASPLLHLAATTSRCSTPPDG